MHDLRRIACVAGKACDSLLAATAAEKQSTIVIIEVPNINSPNLSFVKHLSPAAETRNPGTATAYVDHIVEIDPKAIFLDTADFPSSG